MKKLTFSLSLPLTAIFCLSFLLHPIATAELVGTKWISPINDNCFDSLCFTSENNVMYYRCEQNIYVELGYKIIGDTIEIEAYSKSSMDYISKMIVTEENGILNQLSTQNNSFPRNFIKVPDTVCN